MASTEPKETAAQKSVAAETTKKQPLAEKAGPTTDAAVNRQILNPRSGVTAADADPYNEDGSVRPTAQRSREQEATDEARRRQNDPDAEPFISEGMRHDLEEIGVANDPVTGRRLTMDKDGKVTAEPRE
jgi:hypothetical protein